MNLESLLVTQVLQITAIACVVWLVTQTIARKHAHFCYVLWLVVLLKCVTPPIWSSPMGAFTWISSVEIPIAQNEGGVPVDFSPLSSFSSSDGVHRDPLDVIEISDRIHPTDVFIDSEIERVEQLEQQSEGVAEGLISNTPSPVASIPVSIKHTQPWKLQKAFDWLPVIWLAIGGLLMFWTLFRAIFYIRRLKVAEVENYELQSDVNRLSQSLKLRRPARLLVTSCPIGPAVIGLFRPLIVIPQFIVQQSSVEEMQPILAHELIHIRRGDLWVGLLRHFARTLWWFHPLVWKTSSALRRDAERCCDEEVVASLGISAKEYARALLGVLELKQELKAVPIAPGVRPFDITSKRLERIMHLGQGSRLRTPYWCWAFALLFAIVSLPGRGMMLGDNSQRVEENPAHGNLAEGEQTRPTAPLVPPAELEGLPTVPSVQLQCQILTGPVIAIDGLPVAWRTMSRSDRSQNPFAARKPSNDSQWGQSQVVISKHFPIFYALLDQTEVDSVMQKAQGNNQMSVLMSPRLRTADGDGAHFEVGERKSFVVGVGEQDDTEELWVHEGLTSIFRPSIARSGSRLDVHLAYRFTQTKIRSVDEFSVKTASNAEVRLQIPEVATTTLTGATRVPQGKTLLVRIQSKKDGGDSEQILAVIKPTPLIPNSRPAETVAAETKWQNIPWGMLQRQPSSKVILAPGDVLGVYIVGILGSENQPPPVQLPDAANVPPALGFPIPIRPDGTIPLPMIDDPVVAGITVEEAQQKIVNAYTVDSQILQRDQSIILTLIRPRHVRIMVFRRDNAQRPNLHTMSDKQQLGGGFELQIPARQADVLTALAQTGGLPSVGFDEIQIYRRSHQKSQPAGQPMTPVAPQRIPLRFKEGQPVNISQEDITLHDGDMIVVGRSAEAERRQIPTPAMTPPGQATLEMKNRGHRQLPFLHEVGDLSQYLDSATDVEQPAADRTAFNTSRPTKANDYELQPDQPREQFAPVGPERGRVDTSKVQNDLGFNEQWFSDESLNTRESRKMTLEECISMSLLNSQIARTLGVKASRAAADGNHLPLLRNDGVPHVENLISLHRIDSDVELSDTEINVRNFIYEVTQAYWNLYFHFRNLDAARTSFASAHATWKQTKARSQNEVHGGEAANEAMSRAQYFTCKNRLQQAKSDLLHQESRLRYLLGIAPTDHRLIQPVDRPSKARLEFEWEEIKRQAKEKSPELIRQRARIKQKEIQLATAKKGVHQVALDLYAALGHGTISELNKANSSFVANELLKCDFGDWRTGQQPPLPDWAVQTISDVRNARRNLNRANKRLSDLELEITHQLSAAVRRLRDQYRISQTQFNTLKAYRDQLAAAETAFKLAQSVPLDVVLDAQSRQAQAEIDYFRAITEYNLAIAEVHFRKSTLLQTSGCRLAEDFPQPDLDAVIHAFEKPGHLKVPVQRADFKSDAIW